MTVHPRADIHRWFTVITGALLGFLPPLGAAIPAELFDPDFPAGDCNYHSLTAASDGQIYFSIGTHHSYTSARLFRFDPTTGRISPLGDLNAALGLDPATTLPHGKVHTPLIEWGGHLYFATHTSQYDGSLPQLNPPDGRAPYPGGHFMRLELATGAIEDLGGLGIPNEGLISMAVDRRSGMLFGLTWPSALLVTYDLAASRLVNWGGVQQRGEWGHLGRDWNFVCRSLGMDDAGVLYGSTDQGRIWRFDTQDQRPVSYHGQLSLDAVPPVQSENFTVEPVPHYFWRNWRTIEWNPATRSFWGVHGGSGQLFEFSPERGELRSVRPMVPDSTPPGRRAPHRTQLGFMVGPGNTLFYLAHAAAPEVGDASADRLVTTAVHLLTYRIDTGDFTDHGPVTGPDGRRVFFTESIAFGPDDHLYTVAWVETRDPERRRRIQAARGLAAPDETSDVIYEIQLVRLPRWQSFVQE